jgi:hypothetical protein
MLADEGLEILLADMLPDKALAVFVVGILPDEGLAVLVVGRLLVEGLAELTGEDAGGAFLASLLLVRDETRASTSDCESSLSAISLSSLYLVTRFYPFS